MRRILHRAAPGKFQDPDAVIGNCAYCDEPVTNASGDFAGSGEARHDRCGKLIRRNAVKSECASMICRDVVRILCDISNIPGVASQREAAIKELPENGVTPEDVFAFLSKAIRIVDGSALAPTSRSILRSKFQALKRQLLAELSS